MNMIEQLSLEREQLRKKEPTKEVLNLIRLLDDIMSKLQLKNDLMEMLHLKNRKIIEIKPGNEKMIPFVCDKICDVLERSEAEHKFLYWTTLVGNSIDELEEELDVWLIFSNSEYGARNLLDDMEKEGTITVLSNGIVKKNQYQISKKEKMMVKKGRK